jgi:peroxiredoxin
MRLHVKVTALLIAAAVAVLLGVQFLSLVRPAAAREVQAACRGLAPTPRSKTIRRIPAPAPEFTVTDRNGKPVKLSDYRGKVVVVNFGASWCTTCQSEKPSLQSLNAELGGDDLVVLNLSSDSGWAQIDKKYPDGLNLEVLLDKTAEDEGEIGPVAKAWGIQAVPESFVVDRKGTLRHYFVNKRNWDSDVAITCLRALIDE